MRSSPLRDWLFAAALAVSAVPLAALAGAPEGHQYVLSFEENDPHTDHPARIWMLEVVADGRTERVIDVAAAGPRPHEVVPFAVRDPNNVTLVFRLAFRSASTLDPGVEIGNVRVRAAGGGEVELSGKWSLHRTDPWFTGARWPAGGLPAYRAGLTLRRAAGAPVRSVRDVCEWRFTGALKPIANLRVRRLFEYIGCYDQLNFYNDFSNVRFDPARPKKGDTVNITATVSNGGSLAARGATVSLVVDGKELATERVDVAAAGKAVVRFRWQATPGFHAFLVHVDPKDEIRESREEDNWLLRTLIVGEPREAHPYLLFRRDDVPAVRRRILDALARSPWFQKHHEVTRAKAAAVSGEVERLEETAAIAGSSAALLGLVHEGKPEAEAARRRSAETLQTLWRRERAGPGEQGCSIAHYALAYDWLAPRLSDAEDRQIRRRLAMAVGQLVEVMRTRGSSAAAKSFYPGLTSRMAYTQVTYIRACAVVVAALALAGYDDAPGGPDAVAGEPAYGNADALLHFGLNAIYEEILRPMTTAQGYYREGHGYTHMAENRSGALCWLSLAHIGANAFGLYPMVARLHELYIRDRMPNGWAPPLNDSRVEGALPQILFARLYPNEAEQAAARWDWQTQALTPRGVLPDSHYGPLFLLLAGPEEEDLRGAPPTWPPTQFLGDHLVFRTDWSPDATYLLQNCKRSPTGSRSHDQPDKMSFMFYARRALLAVDPGYGNTAPPELIKTVLDWTRSSPYAHNQVVVDGLVPQRRFSLYTYGPSPLPKNCFSTDWLDFGEALLSRWDRPRLKDEKDVARPWIVGHRRSVIFLRERGYGAIVDNLRDLMGAAHSFELTLQGNCRRPWQNRDRPGDFVTNGAVLFANNLTVKPAPPGLEATWMIENADGKPVAFRAFVTAPPPDRAEGDAAGREEGARPGERGAGQPASLTWRVGDGWLAYARPVARNKYLVAKVDGSQSARFLSVLYPEIADDPQDDAKMESVGTNAVRVVFRDGVVHLFATRSPTAAPLRVGRVELRSDADIAFLEFAPAGELRACFLARGKELRCGDVAIRSSVPIVLALDLRDKSRAAGYFIAQQPSQLQLLVKGKCTGVTVNGAATPFALDEGYAIVPRIEGRGQIVVSLAP